METDGAVDQATRFPKTLSTAVDLFKDLKLDVLLHGVNASGLSTFKILPHNSLGNHLDSAGKQRI